MKRGFKLILITLGLLVLIIIIQFLVVEKLDGKVMEATHFAEISENQGIPKKLPSVFDVELEKAILFEKS